MTILSTSGVTFDNFTKILSSLQHSYLPTKSKVLDRYPESDPYEWSLCGLLRILTYVISVVLSAGYVLKRDALNRN